MSFKDTGVLSVLQTFSLSRDKLQEVKSEKESELDFLEKQTLVLTTEMKDKIKAMVEEVERKVRKIHLFMYFFSVPSIVGMHLHELLIFFPCNNKFYLMCRFLML